MENFDSMDPHTYLTIPMIGQVVEKLMGNAFQLYYTSRNFKAKYDRYKRLNQVSFWIFEFEEAKCFMFISEQLLLSKTKNRAKGVVQEEIR